MEIYSNVTIGSDPEFFLKSKKTNEIVSAIGLVGGTKDHPIPISNNGHGLQEDNVAVEATIPPCKTKKELIENINFIKDYITKRIAEPNGLEISFQASAFLNKKYLKHPAALVFGCEPDFSVWLQDINPRPKADDPTLRSVGGHIHIGYEDPNEEKSVEIVKAMDLFLGVPSILLDSDTERRKLYGKAGAFRFKHYGVEYRTLSNFWTKDENSMSWLYDQIQLMFNFLNSGNKITDEEGKNIIECINSQNIKLANNLIKKYKLECVEL